MLLIRSSLPQGIPGTEGNQQLQLTHEFHIQTLIFVIPWVEYDEHRHSRYTEVCTEKGTALVHCNCVKKR